MRRLVVAALVAGMAVAGGLGAGMLAAPSAGAAPGKDVRIVNINLLHGLICPPETSSCQAKDRVALLARQLEDSKCPEIVGLQEINALLGKLLDAKVKTLCGGKYTTVFGSSSKTSTDRERVLTTLPASKPTVQKLVGNFRSASRVVLKSALGPVVLVVTHQDGDPPGGPIVTTCRSCKPPCSHDRSIFECQTTAAAAMADEVGGPSALRVLMGDFNVDHTSLRYQHLIEDGWVDSHLAAGNPECDPATGTSCTSGRDDAHVEALKDPNAKESERIDFIFLKPAQDCTLALDPASDDDGDGIGTGLWNAAPATDGPGGIVFPSDHTGVSADVSCASKG